MKWKRGCHLSVLLSSLLSLLVRETNEMETRSSINKLILDAFRESLLVRETNEMETQ